MMLRQPDSGAPYYPGHTVREWVFNCDSTTLPDWLELDDSDGATLGAPSFETGYARMTLTVPAGIGNKGGIRTSFNINSALFPYAAIIFDGVTIDSSSSAKQSAVTLGVYIGDRSTGGAEKTNDNSVEQFVVYPGSAETTRFRMLDDPHRQQSVGIIANGRTKEVAMVDGDVAFNGHQIVERKGFVNSTGPAGIELINKDSSEHILKISKITLRLVTP